jgi:TM2 domain-containing membrane protein YozV
VARKNKLGFLYNPLIGLVKKSANTFFQSIADSFVSRVKKYFVCTANIILGLFFFFFFWLGLNVMIVEVFRDFLHLKLFFSILIVAILNLIIAMLFFNAGMKKIKDEDEES